MGSSLVKPSRRESRRRGVNDASASRGDVHVIKSNFDGKKDEGYKVDTLTGPVSNYCKPVTVISQSDNIKNRSSLLPSDRRSDPEHTASGEQDLHIDENSQYVPSVLKTGLSFQETFDQKYEPLKNKKFGKGSGDSLVVSPPALSGNQEKPSSRRKRFFSASCIGKGNETPEATTNSPKAPCEKIEVKFKESDSKIHIVEPKHDNQDVSRDARTPSPEFNDFENVIVTEPRASTSSPIDKYIHSKNSEAAEEESPTTVSIKQSENPAPVHQGELRCELSKKDKSSTTLITSQTQNQFPEQGDHPDTDFKTETQRDATVSCNIEINQNYEHGESKSEKRNDYGNEINHAIGRNSITEKIIIPDFEDENTLQVAESFGLDVEALSEPGLPQTNTVIRRTEEQKIPLCIQSYNNCPSKECKRSIESKLSTGDYLTQFKMEEKKVKENLYLCANVKPETRTFQEIFRQQGCATGATKCLDDVDQFDYNNGDGRNKCKKMSNKNVSDFIKCKKEKCENVEASEVLTQFRTEENLDLIHVLNEQLSPSTFQEEKEQRLEDSSINPACGTNKSEPDMSTQTRMGRLNCWRPESGGCGIDNVDKDKRQKCENRPASWSHISSKQQQHDIKHPNIRPCSAATGDTLWGNEGAINIALPFVSTSSSALDVSQSPSNTSLPRRQRSHQSIEYDKSCHSDVMNISDISNTSACESLKESRNIPVTLKTSFNVPNESFKAPSACDLARVPSSQIVQKSRPTSAHSSQTSVDEPTGKLSQQSLPRLSGRNSRHNLSRSLSNHSSVSNAIHSPRPPSSDSLKHSPRPPSGLSEEGYLRTVRSRTSSVHLSGSLTTAVKRFSDHSLSKEASKKSNSQLSEQSHNQQTNTSNKGDSVSATQDSLPSSQIKLPPIKTTTNVSQLRQSAESRAHMSQSFSLPPVISVATDVRPFEQDQRASTLSSDTTSSWHLSCNLRGSSLPPVPGREADAGRIPECKEDIKSGLSTYGDSKVDGCRLPFDNYSYKKSYNVQQKTIGSAQELIDAYISSDVEHDNLQVKPERADDNLLPNGSQMGVDEISHAISLAQKRTSNDISRLLADYLPHKDSARVDSNTAPDLCPTAVSSANDQVDEIHETLVNIRAEAMLNPTNSPEYTEQSSDFVAKDHLSISPGQRDKPFLTNDKSEHFRCSPSENNGAHTNSQQLKESENKEAMGEGETQTGPSSLPLINYYNVLAKSSTSANEDLHKFDHASLYTTGENQAVEKCAHASESATYCKSNTEEMLNCNNFLENCLIPNGDAKCNNKISKDLPGGKSKTVDKDYFMNLNNKQGRTILFSSNVTSSASPKNAIVHTNISEDFSHSSRDSSEEERNAAPPKQASEENKPNSTSSAFDVAALMAKYCEGKSETRSASNQTPTSVHTCDNETSCVEYNMISEDQSAVLAYESKSNEKNCKIFSGGDFELDGVKPNPERKMDQLSIEEKAFSVEKIRSAKIDNNMSLEGNMKPKSQHMEKDEDSHLVRPSNDQHEKVSEFCSIYGPKTGEQNDLSTPKALQGKTEEKKKLGTPGTEESDYMTKMSNRMSSFSERFADISNITGLYLSIEENMDTREVMNSKIGTFSNVLPIAVDGDKIVEKERNDSHEELEERRSHTICCSAKIEPGKVDDPRMNINEALVDAEIKSSLRNSCHMPKPEDRNIELVDKNITECDTKLKENINEDNVDTKFATTAPKETSASNAETRPLEGGQIKSVDEVPGSGYNNINLQEKPFSIKEEDESVSKDLHNLSPQVEPPFERNESFDENKRSPTDYNRSEECTTLKRSDHEPDHNTYRNENCESESIKTLSGHNGHLELQDRLKKIDDETVPNKMNESNYKCENFSTETQHGNVDLNYGPDFPQNNANHGVEIKETSSKTALSKISPPESHPILKEEIVPEILPSERIDTIKKQIYEEGLKPCQRDGGVAFFIPVSNTGLQPPVSNPEIGERLAKPKKPSMSYEERMMMADINRQEQLGKRKEFAVKDLINVKSATASNSSASGENISGGAEHDRSDRSDSGSLH